MNSGQLLVNGNDFYIGNEAEQLSQLARLDQIPSQYVHPSAKQCNYAYTHPAAKQCSYSVQIIDNLNSVDATSALSANQGRILNTLLNNIYGKQRVETLIYSGTLSSTANQSDAFNTCNIPITHSMISKYTKLRLSYELNSIQVTSERPSYMTYGYFGINTGNGNSPLIEFGDQYINSVLNLPFDIYLNLVSIRDGYYKYAPIGWSDYKNFPIIYFSNSGISLSFFYSYGSVKLALYGIS